ncbi:MAG: hypothetical protein QGI78_08560 [Phycisphaerales bacterium]|jgi:hypothetical protein|nr:hypothetical protein [Phycisphaerales bacterium]
MRILCETISILFLLIFVQTAQAEGLQIRHLSGGPMQALEVEGSYWYQAVGDQLVVLEKTTGKKVGQLQLSSRYGSSVCTDLLIHEGLLWALLKNEKVVCLSLDTPKQPQFVKASTSQELGIAPHGFTVISDWPVVFGDRGAVRLGDGRRLVECEGVVTGLALSLDRGVVFAQDRRLYDASTNEFLGSATRLEELDPHANADVGTLVFSRDLGNRTEVGLMTPEGRAIEAVQGSVTLEGGDAALNAVGSRVRVCTDAGVYILGVAPRELRVLKTIPMQGAKDVDSIGRNYLAICADQGREMYRLSIDRGGEGDTHLRQVPATSAMGRGSADRLGIDIPTATGTIRYTYGDSFERCESVSLTPDENPTDLVVLGWSVSQDQHGTFVFTDAKGELVEGVEIENVSTVEAISGNFWFGTGSGIFVYGPNEQNRIAQLASISLAGPVIQLVPQLDGSAAFVSAEGYVGVVVPTF